MLEWGLGYGVYGNKVFPNPAHALTEPSRPAPSAQQQITGQTAILDTIMLPLSSFSSLWGFQLTVGFTYCVLQYYSVVLNTHLLLKLQH